MSIAPIVLAVALAGCGGGSKTNTTTATAAVTTVEQVKRTWVEFFEASTSPARKVTLLQKGQQFASVIQAEASSPLVKEVKVAVNKVTLLGATRATVLYTITIGGRPVLAKRTGTAVLEGGSWRVSASSFCALLALEAATPAACRHV